MSRRGTIIIQGPPPDLLPSGAPPPRREIHDLISDQRQFSLWVQAVAQMQKTEQTNSLSWYGISGIHGLPREAWDNASPKPRVGYCVHGLPLFPVWHRPYVTLYEQALQSQAAKVANEYAVDKEQWVSAAQELRAPYWDWALYITPPEEVYQSQTLKIITKDGPTDFPNPLLAYNFNPPMPAPYDDKATYRTPGMLNRLRSVQWTLKNDVYRSLTLIKNWREFSMHGSGGRVANSLETLHNGMHVRIGGAGSMSDPNIAAFDPIFWLHHANVDRQLALWQAINPNVWVDPRDLETDLSPFWNTDTTFHRSSSPAVRRWTGFRFDYPEFKDLVNATPEQIQRAIFAAVRDLYGPDRSRGDAEEDFTDWFARVRSQTYALGGSYSIFLFFGEPPESPAEWREAENLIGVDEVFANPHPEDCPNCIANLDSLHEGIISLTDPLRQREQYDQGVDAIKAYIQDNLKWRVQKVDGTVVPNEQLPGLEVRVESTEITFDIPRDGPSIPTPVAGEPQEHIRF